MNAVSLPPNLIAFEGEVLIAQGNKTEVAKKLVTHLRDCPHSSLLIFDNVTSAPVEMDLRGTLDEVLSRLGSETVEDSSALEKAGPGRPKLGVVSREVGLLPRQWEWLQSQPGGASVTLRKLVDEARKQNQSRDERKRAQNSVYKFMTAMAGNLPHYEEALRALFACDKALFVTLSKAWSPDIRNHTLTLAEKAFD